MLKTWTDEMDAALRKHRDEGLSFGAVARVMNRRFKVHLSRSACVGRAHRLGLTVRSGPVSEKIVSRKTRRMPPKQRQLGHLAAFLSSRPTTMPELETPADEAPKVSLLDLEAHHCRYPIGTPGTPGFGFCGDKHIPGLSYCERHAIRCMVPETVRTERRREFVLRKIGIGAARELRTALEDA